MEVDFPKLTDKEREGKLNIPAGKIHLIIDTDAKNEVDDQFAVSWAIRSPERFIIDAIYAAPYSHDCYKRLTLTPEERCNYIYSERPDDGMEASYQEVIKLFRLLGKYPDKLVFRGSKEYITDSGGPVDSEAARDLINRAMSSEETIYVAAIGTPTNIASALMMEPELVKKIVVIWLGGQPLYFKNTIEFNLVQDIAASRILFNSGVPLVMIPCMNVASLLTITKPELEDYMRGKNAISDYLSTIVLNALPDNSGDTDTLSWMMRDRYLSSREDRSDAYLLQFPTQHVAPSRIIWDISTIAFLKNPGWTPSLLEASPVLKDSFTWGSRDESRHRIRVVNYCQRDLIFGDMIACLTK